MKFAFISMTLFALSLGACQAKYDVDGEVTSRLARNELLAGETPAIDVLTQIGEVNNQTEVEASVEQVQQLCESRPLESLTQTIRFDPPGETCNWEQNDNLAPLNMFLQARTEQAVPLNLPSGAIPCDMDLRFPSQNFRYDDHFVLSLNRSVLASSLNFSEILETGSNNILLYDWSRIAGSPWDTNNELVYCPAINGTSLQCDFPGHDEEGDIQIQLGPQHVLGAISNGTPLNGSYFQMVTIGDNDALDCEHTGMEFEVTVDFVR